MNKYVNVNLFLQNKDKMNLAYSRTSRKIGFDSSVAMWL